MKQSFVPSISKAIAEIPYHAIDDPGRLYTVNNMILSQVSRQTLADQVYDRVVEAVVVGDIPSGAAISENEIAIRFGVSRGPAREAIFRLEAKGLITRAAHHGARIVDLTLSDLQALFEIREALEGMCSRLAAERITDAELAELESKLGQDANRPEVAAGQFYYQASGDQDFHIAIAAASHNARLHKSLTGDLYDVMRVYRFRSSARPGRALDALNEHKAILAALRARDPAAAETAMRTHIRASWANIQSTFKDVP
jgi:DNA-binding GntR family transcriptional regulator